MMRRTGRAALLLIIFAKAAESKGDECLQYGSRPSLEGILEIQMLQRLSPYGLPGIVKPPKPEFFLRLAQPICARSSETLIQPSVDNVQKIYLRRSTASPEGAELTNGAEIIVKGLLLHGFDEPVPVILNVDEINRR